MKRIIKLLLLFPALMGCSFVNEVYEGDKIILPYVEGGEIVFCSVDEAYDMVKIQKKDGAFFICDETLIPCVELRNTISVWCQGHNAAIYEIDYTLIDEAQSILLTEMTEGYYEWSDEVSIPCVYFFKEGQTKMRSDSSNTTTYLNRYVEVNKPEN